MIPAALNRVERILSVLESHPVLGPLKEEWLIDTTGNSITEQDLLRVHSENYMKPSKPKGIDEIVIQAFELVDGEGRFNRYEPKRAKRPLAELFDLAVKRNSGTYECCCEALRKGFCFFLGGGAHHGHRDFGHGFCIMNDSVVALRKCQAVGSIERAWVIDVDAHKGDGTAALTHNDDSIATLSVHMARGWPLDGSVRGAPGERHPTYIPSDFDVPIDVGEEHLYLPALETALKKMAGGTRPDLALVLCGADPYEKDALASTRKLRLTLDQIKERDRFIYNFLKEKGIPQAYLMAGGYGEFSWEPYPPFLEYVLLDRLGIDGQTNQSA